MEPAPDRFSHRPPVEPSRPPPPREKVFNAPLLAVLLAGSMPALFFFQNRSSDSWIGLAFSPSELAEGRWSGLFTAMLVHAGWVHALMNAVGALTFGTPVARLLRGPAGVAAFLALYTVSGVVGSLGYGVVHLGQPDLMVGASGAVFGLIGTATRLLGGQGRVLALTDRRVITSGIAWMAVNALIGLIGFAPGADGARIAWEAHAFGFLAGLLLIGPLGRLFGRPKSAFDSIDGLSDPRL